MRTIRYYISDHHFFNPRFHTWRGFASMEDMTGQMVRRWNARVQEEDEVYVLGDFSEGTGEQTNELLRSLKGKKYLLKGNHDDFLSDPVFDRSLFAGIADYLELRDGDTDLVLSHYPMPCYNGQYRELTDPTHRTCMLYGHVHNSYDEVLLNEHIRHTRAQTRQLEGLPEPKHIPCRMYNCFCRFSDYYPLTLEQWEETDAARREGFRHMDYF